MVWWQWVLAGIGAFLASVAAHAVLQREHAVLRSFPIIGHVRYLLEGVGPELRQYIVTDNDSDRPFSRDQRRWIYSSAKHSDAMFGFGTDNDLDGSDNYLIVKQVAFPLEQPRPGDPGHDPTQPIGCGKVLDSARRAVGRTRSAWDRSSTSPA